MSTTITPSPDERLEALLESLEEHFSDRGCAIDRALGEVTVVVPAEELRAVADGLKRGKDFGFELLMDVCAVDYAAYGRSQWQTVEASASGFGRGLCEQEPLLPPPARRFAVVYHLLSVRRNLRLRLRVPVDEETPVVPSLVPIWSSANWFEREAFDLFGILFEGHPDLRRILTDYGFVGHPFRKDFPLIGQVEMRYDPEQQRVVYEPVSIEPRTLVPRVIRDDNRYLGPEGERPAAESD